MEYTPRRNLTREFKLEAVRRAALSEKPKAQMARELAYASVSCERGGSSSRRRR